MNFVTLRRTWWLTLILAYLPSFLWLNVGAMIVPSVVALAPLGITALFHPPPYNDISMYALGAPEYCLHAVFWSLFLLGAFGCKRLPLKMATAIYLTIFTLLILTLAGCSQYYHFNGHHLS